MGGGAPLKSNNNNGHSQDPLGEPRGGVSSMLRPVCAGCEEGPGVCAMALTVFSLVLIIFTLPLSLVFVVKVVQVRSTSLIP